MTHNEFVAAINRQIQKLTEQTAAGPLAINCIAKATLTDPKDWEFTSGPQSGEGDDIYLRNEKRGLAAWMWDDGSVIHTMEITNTAYRRAA